MNRLMPLFIFLILLCIPFAVNALTISTAQGLIDFSNAVNRGTSYSGTTVLLTSDIDLTGKTMEPIGKTMTYYFRGSFDGLGHTISNLKMKSSIAYVGLFGFTYGMKVKNVVLDSTCSIESSYSSTSSTIYSFTGGIVGLCYSTNTINTIESSVNMASLTFSGSTNGNSYMGGISGCLHSETYDFYVKNCANYGSIILSGYAKGRSPLGGIVGECWGDNTAKYIQNCLNYGTLTHKGTTGYLNQGGIVGYSQTTNIENCLSAGRMSASGSMTEKYAGSIVGFIKSNTNIKYSYFTSDVGISSLYGYGTPANTTGSPTSASTLSNAVNSLNNRSTTNSWNKWLLNENSAPVSFKINNYKGFTVSAKAVIFPDLSNTSPNVFTGWYNTTKYDELFQGTSVSSNTTFYGLYGPTYTVSFSGNGGGDASFTSKKVVSSINYGELPTATRTGYTFLGWFTDETGGTKIESTTGVTTTKDQKLYAHWKANTYNITFDTGNGNDPETKQGVYDSEIQYPENPVRTGYTFAGWSISPDTVPAGDITIKALWKANNYTITFNTTSSDGDGGSGSTQFQQSATYDSEYGSLPLPERTGYTFAGWFTEEGGQGDRIESTTNVGTAANHTLYAHWDVNNYTITFDYGDGRESEERVLDFSDPINYTDDPVREGYTFGGWSPRPDTVPAEDTTIKALWTPNNYTLAFDAAGGEGVGDEDGVEVTYDSVYGVLPAPERTGYTFDGWFIVGGEGEGEGDTEITCESVVKITSDVTLHARWTINHYTITFVLGNGSEDEERVLAFNATIDYPEDVVREGYRFSGWSPRPDTVPAGNITVTAQWVVVEGSEKHEQSSKPSKPTKPSEYVEVVFGKAFTQDEVRDILDDYAKDAFTITGFEWDDKAGETRVIVKFSDSSSAAEFVESISENGKEEDFIRGADFASGKESFTHGLSPLCLLCSMVVFLF